MRHSRLLVLVVTVGFLVTMAASAHAQSEPSLHDWWISTFGNDASWDAEADWVDNYVLNSPNGTWREYQTPDEAGFDLTSHFWSNGWTSREVKLQVEYTARDRYNSFGYYEGDTRYQLFAGTDSAGARSSMTAPHGQFGFYLDATTGPYKQYAGLWYTDTTKNQPYYANDVNPYMQAVVMKHPTAQWGGWILGWGDISLSKGEDFFSGWGEWEPDYNDMIVSVEKTPEPVTGLLLLAGLPIAAAMRRRKED